MNFHISPLKLLILAVTVAMVHVWLTFFNQVQLITAADFVQQSGPDLLVEDVMINPSILLAGEAVDVNPIIKNQGSERASIVKIHVYIAPIDNPPTVDTPTEYKFTFGLGLDAGDTYDNYAVLDHLLEQNNPQICVWVDPENQVHEIDETNNLFCLLSTEPALPEDDFEDDDQCKDANSIEVDEATQEHNLSTDANDATGVDYDWLQFEAESGIEYIVDAMAIGADAKLQVGLYSECGGPLSLGRDANLHFTAPRAGTYYLKVSHREQVYGPNTTYSISIRSQAACASASEPNNRCTFPSDFSLSDGVQQHSFCEEGDVDWIRFEVEAGGKYRVSSEGIGANAQVELGIYESCNEQIFGTQEFEFTAPRSGHMYLSAQSSEPALFGTGTEYNINIDILERGCNEDNYDPDNELEQAQILLVDGNKHTHTFCPKGDVDWVKIEVTPEEDFTVETFNLAKNADTKICLFDTAGAELVCDKDSGAGLGSRITYENPSDTVYYASIQDENPEVAGDTTEYSLRATSSNCAEDSHEPDNERSQAKSINPDGSGQRHNICQANDVDWVSFQADAEKYTIFTDEVGPEGDTEIELYDASGNLLARNDDFTLGIESQIVYTFPQAGRYYLKIQLYNPQLYGKGTEYQLKVQPGEIAPPDPPEPQFPPSSDSPATGSPTDVRTLILVNADRLAELHDDNKVDQLLEKLQLLTEHSSVMGEIIRLDRNQSISAAYDKWTTGANSLKSVERANMVADAIRRQVMIYLRERVGVEFVVLVGDDLALPFRRVRDNTAKQPEQTYEHVIDAHPTGAALLNNYFLTDDFYVDLEPTIVSERELYIPDLSIGRLIETPDDMLFTIDTFLANPRTMVENVLVTGYDFVKDSAAADCVSWRKKLTEERVQCLIGENWSELDLTDLQLRTSSPFKIQSINGHADHFREGIPVGETLEATEIAEFAVDLSGGLVYTLGCHSGLNVPEANGTKTEDLAEIFIRTGANYVGNTGYGWGYIKGIGLSEKVMQLFTAELLKGGPMGQSLAKAKQLYFQQTAAGNPLEVAYQEKVMQQLVYYGLPMFETIGSLSASDDPFPGVIDNFDNTGTLSPGENSSLKEISIDFKNALEPETTILEELSTDDGNYQTFGGYTYASPSEAIQPLYFQDVSLPEQVARSAIVRNSSVYQVTSEYDPVVATPYNEFVESTDEERLSSTGSNVSSLAANASIQTWNDQSNLLIRLGNYNPNTNEQAIFDSVEVDLFYSTSPDYALPEFTVISGLYDPTQDLIYVKAGATDPSGIQAVYLEYADSNIQSSDLYNTSEMSFNPRTQKWEEVFEGNLKSHFSVYAVDGAGNMAHANNKGERYQPVQARDGTNLACIHVCNIYVPLIQ